MSTTPAVAAAPAAGNGGTPPTKAKIETVPADIRRRALGMKPLPPPTAEETEAKKKEKEEADRLAKAKLDEEKKKTDEAAGRAAADAGATVDKVKKVKAGPPLPEAPTEQTPTNLKSVADAVREVLPEITRSNAAAAAPALSQEEQAEVDLARFAERKNPERYAGFADKVKNFYSAHEQHRAEQAARLGGPKSADFKDYLESDEYREWVKENRPAYARGDRDKLKEDVIAERARDDAKREMAPQLKALERQTAELKYAPMIQAKTNDALKIIISDVNAEKDAALEGFAKDPVKFGEAHPEEAQIIAAEAGDAVELIEEVYRIDHDLVDFNPKAPTPKQAKIRTFVLGQNASLRQQYPNGIEMKDGKILIDAETFAAKKLGNDPRYRVFTADEIAGMLATTRNAQVLEKLKRRREGITKSVYTTKVETPVAPPAGKETPPDEDPPAPGAGTRAAPGSRVKTKENKSLARKYA
jgi:hypothetical protein